LWRISVFLIENLEHLLQIRFGVFLHLFARERRARFGYAGGIADHGGKIPNQENRGVAQILKLFQFAQHHRVAQVNIRRGRVHAEIHAQRLIFLKRIEQLVLQLLFTDDFRGAFGRERKLFQHRLEFFLRH